MIEKLELILIVISTFLFLSVLLSKISRYGIPFLILFIGLGIIAGTEGLGIIDFENYEIAYSCSVIALCFILFTGAIETNYEDIKPVKWRGLILANFGVLFVTLSVALFVHYFLQIPWNMSLLLGAVISSTDAAAVFSIFKGLGLSTRKKLKSIIEFESGSNDPMAYLLVLFFLSAANLELVYTPLTFLWNIVVGFLGGALFATLFIFIANHITLHFIGLYTTLTFSLLLMTYAITSYFHGNGFLAVYIFGLVLGTKRYIHKRVLLSFFDGVSWLMQIGLFVLLGLLVFPSRLIDASYEGLLVSFFLIFVARPASVFLSLINSQFDWKEKLFISWAGLKGAVPIAFASLVAIEKGEQSYFIFDIVFFSVLVSAIVQGWTLRPVARLLKVTEDEKFDMLLDIDDPESFKDSYHVIKISPGDFANGKTIVELNIPKGTLFVCIKRHNLYLTPHGGTVIEPGDQCHVLCTSKNDVFSLRKILHLG